MSSTGAREGHALRPRRRRRHPRRARARHRHRGRRRRSHSRPRRRPSRHASAAAPVATSSRRTPTTRPARLRGGLAADLERPHELTPSASTPRRWSPTRSRSARPSSRSFRPGASSRAAPSPSASPRPATREPHGGRACCPVSPTRLPGRGHPSGRATPSSRTTPCTAPGWLRRSASPSERTPTTSTSTALQTGLTWSAPVAAVTGPTGDLDKEWITCDNGAASPFRGNCYLSYFHVGSGEIRTTTTTDGGVTWSQPVASSPVPPRGVRLQRRAAARPPQRQPRRRLHRLRRPELGARSEIQATRSTDGGASFSAPVRVSLSSRRRTFRRCERSRSPRPRSTPPAACTSSGRAAPEAARVQRAASSCPPRSTA